MFIHHRTWKGRFFVSVLFIMGLLCLVVLVSTQTMAAEPTLATVPKEISTETELPRIWPHLDMSATITPAPLVGQIATVRIEIISAIDDDQVAIFTQMSPEITLAGGEAMWVGPVQANKPLIHEFTIKVQEPGQWVIYMSAVSLNGAVAEDQLHINSTVIMAEVVPSVEYRVFQSKEEWPGDPAELIPYQFPQHPESASKTDTGNQPLLLTPVTVEGMITFAFEYQDCLSPPCPGLGPGEVFTETTKPLRNAQIWLYDRATSGADHYLATTTTDHTGFYTFTVENIDPDGDGTGIDPLITIFPAGTEGNQ